MPINDPTDPQTALRTPRLRILADGKILPGAICADIQTNSYYQADHFSVEFAINAGPPGWWDVEPPWVVDIQFSLDAQNWTSLIIGEIDQIHPHLQTGLMSVEGRDLSARLIETKTQAAYQNQTSSEIAEALALKHHLSANIAPTKTLVSRYYEQDHTKITMGQFSREQTEWDLLVYLARLEGFDVFMTGQTLNFVPSVSPDSDPFLIQWTPPNPVPRLNVTSLQMERSLTRAKDIQVTVHSWNSRQARGFTKVVKAIGTRRASASSAGKSNVTQNYVITRANLTEDQALQLAQNTLREQTKHERVVNVSMPGDLTLTPRNMARIGGTGTTFDTVYFIDHIQRSLRFDGGFEQHVRLKNSSPRSEVEVR